MSAYYNEHDPFAAAWLRELIKAGHIADGEVDERSIEDVRPDELTGFTQCLFFAGIGVWSYALRQAGWTDDRPVWTGSAPCQPYSAAGKGDGFADERHLWPAFDYLIAQRRPRVVFGEQVEAAIKHGWLDLVQTDLEGKGYAFGSAGINSACIGGQDIRARIYFVADSDYPGSQGRQLLSECADQFAAGQNSLAGELVDTQGARSLREPKAINSKIKGQSGGHLHHFVGSECISGKLADTISSERGTGSGININQKGAELEIRIDANGRGRIHRAAGAPARQTFWDDAEWLFCRDEKWRAVEPGTFPLAHGATNRVGRLRGYGNAINAKTAQAFIESYLGIVI